MEDFLPQKLEMKGKKKFMNDLNNDLFSTIIFSSLLIAHYMFYTWTLKAFLFLNNLDDGVNIFENGNCHGINNIFHN